MRIYLDSAATTQLHPEVIATMTEVMKQHYGNPSSIHAEGRTSRAMIEAARKTVANTINASIGEVFFTSCGTESNNMILKCAVRDLGVKRIISSPIEHHCVLHSLEQLKGAEQVEVVFLNINEKGQVDYNQLASLLKDQSVKTMVSLMHANNEIGTLLDIESVANLCQENQAYFHTDTVQTIGYYPIDVDTMPIHFLAGSAHKFHGPKGVGFVYINGDCMLKPFVDGGAQERNMRGGTENLYGIIGLAKALELSTTNMEEKSAYISNLRNYLKDQLSERFEDIQFNGDPDNCHYKVLSVSFPPSDKSDMLLLNLDISGISASGGSACSSGAETGSHVLNGIKADPERKTIRFSFSQFNTREELDTLLEKLEEMVERKEQKQNSGSNLKVLL